jgi:hypothetical protein
MFDLFKWGFVVALVLTWLAVGVGALMLLIPVKSRERRSAIAIETARAA